MRKYTLILCSLLFASTVAHAQKRRSSTPAAPTISLSQAMSQYRFTEAESILNNEIAALRRKKLDTSEAETKLRAVARAKSRMHVTEKITFIDSVVINVNDLTKHFHLSNESGSIDTYAHRFQKPDSTLSTVYLSQLGDKMVFAQPDSEGQPQLYSASLIGGNNGGEWTAPISLASIGLGDHGDECQNFPFVMADGTTLYFAAKGEESIGGYDIFMTRYDADEHRFLSPENIGMPFNSPANDYLYAVDEFHNIGWFATDRNQPADSVCVYTFIPNSSRRIYNISEISEDQLRSYARLQSIAETWSDNTEVQNKLNTLKELRTQSSHDNSSTSSDFLFVLNDSRTYTSLNDFRSDEARKQAQWWMEGKRDLQNAEAELEALRQTYMASDKNARKAMANQVRQLEVKVETLIKNLNKQEKEIRRQEAK